MEITRARSLAKMSYIAGLTALAIVLKLRYFEIPYPPAPFLKYDISGVPLAAVMFLSSKAVLPSMIAYYFVHVVMLGSDPIGMAMKCLAEASTFIPLVLIYRRFNASRRAITMGTLVATACRSISMSIANLVVTPHWLLIVKWAKDYSSAMNKTLALMPHIVIFNVTIGLIVAGLSITIFNVLRKTGVS